MIHDWIIAARLFLGKAGARLWEAAQGVSLRTWLIVALVVAVPANGCHQHGKGYQKGREAILSQLRDAQAKADKRALEAIAKAEGRATIEVERFEAEQNALREAIKQAEAAGNNPLDAVFK